MYKYAISICISAAVVGLTFTGAASAAGAAKTQASHAAKRTSTWRTPVAVGSDPALSPEFSTDPGGGGGSAPFPCDADHAWAIMSWEGYYWQCRPTATGWQWVIYAEACNIAQQPGDLAGNRPKDGG